MFPLLEIEEWARTIAAVWERAPLTIRPSEPSEKDILMTQPVYYVEIKSPDLNASRAFMVEVFGLDPQPFPSPDYLVAAAGEGPGVDTGLMPSADGQPRTVPVIRVDSIDTVADAVRVHGGTVVVEPFTITGMGRGCYVLDPAGVLLGVHEYDFTAHA